MLLRELNDTLLKRFQSLSVDNADDRKKGIASLNIAIAAVWRSAYWPFRKRLGQLTLIPTYTTGTCTITKYDGTNETDAKKVTFSTALTQKMVGRFFQPNASSTWYKIVAIAGNDAYLDTPIIDTSASGVTFKIWKRFYYLKSEVDLVLDGFSHENGVMVDHRSDTTLNFEGSDVREEGATNYMGDFGIDPYDDVVYNTGSIQIPVNDDEVTGTGTLWLSNVEVGDILKVNVEEYYIKRIESDTKIILYTHATQPVASSTYEIRKNNPIGLQFYRASDTYRVVDYTYLTKPYELKNEDFDLFPMDFDYVKAVLDRSEAIILKDIDKPEKWSQAMQMYLGEIEGLKEKKNVVRGRATQFAPTVPSFMAGRGN